MAETETKPKTKSTHSRIERLLIVLGLVVVAVLAYSYFADIPLRKLFSPWDHSDLSGRVVGTVIKVEGRVLRQRSTEIDFKPLEESQPLYANDTIRTGPDSSVIIALTNGKKLEIKPNSLVKLTFASDLNGEVRIDVLQGGTTDDFARVVPLKGQYQQHYEDDTPPVVSLASPEPGASFAFNEDEFTRRRKSIGFSFKLDRQPRSISVQVWSVGSGASGRRKLSSAAPKIDKELRASIGFNFERPGAYEWQVLDRHGKPLLTQNFNIRPEVQAIHALPPLNNSTKVQGDSAKRSYEGIVLRWEAVAGVSLYSVSLWGAGGKKLLSNQQTKYSELAFAPHVIRFKRSTLRYSIESTLSDGFLIQSGLQTLTIEVVPPTPSTPEQDLVFNEAKLYSSNNAVFLTWFKTNYTSHYELEVATEPHFKRPILQKLTKDNYVPFVTPPNGEYYWRVRANIEGRWTEFSKPFHFKIALEN